MYSVWPLTNLAPGNQIRRRRLVVGRPPGTAGSEPSVEASRRPCSEEVAAAQSRTEFVGAAPIECTGPAAPAAATAKPGGNTGLPAAAAGAWAVEKKTFRKNVTRAPQKGMRAVDHNPK